MKHDYAYGLHAVESLIRHKADTVLELFLMTSRKDKALVAIQEMAQAQGIAIQYTDRNRLDRMVDGAPHQGVVARVRQLQVGDESELLALLQKTPATPFVLFLDGIQDPHNLGACIRSAEAAGAHAVVFPRDKSASLTAVARKAAAGAADRLPLFQVANLARTIEAAKQAGLWMVGAAGESDKTIYEIDLNGPLGLVLGAEGGGLRQLVRKLCDHLAAIPMAEPAESLNVSVAAGVFLFEAVRQRQSGAK